MIDDGALTAETEKNGDELFTDSGGYNKSMRAKLPRVLSLHKKLLQIQDFNRAARIIDMMEEKGIMSKANHVGKREVL